MKGEWNSRLKPNIEIITYVAQRFDKFILSTVDMISNLVWIKLNWRINKLDMCYPAAEKLLTP
jgi:hypothetical protein